MSLEFERVITANWGDDSVRSLAGYEAKGGYAGLRTALEMAPDDVIAVVKDSGLRGRGGAGFPTGMKWSFVPQDTGKPTYVTVNFDESEPGTCNNRELMEREPHQMLEGAMIAAYAIRCHTVFVYCRGEFLWPGTVVQRAIAELYAKGYAGKGILGSDYDLDIVMHRGAGAYICGEETALLSSLEGFRGQPRLRPPFPAVEGLYESPTVINNVETLCNVPHIVKRGADWFKSQGTEKSPGTKMFTISGKVERPGNYELPLGTPFRVLLEDYAGGMLGGGRLKAWTPGGSSTPMLTAEHLDVGLDFESIAAVGSLLGTGACMVMDRERLHRRGRPAPGGVLRARVLREVHALPRGDVVGGARARAHRGGVRTRGGHAAAVRGRAATSCSGPSARWPTEPCLRSPRRCSTSWTSTRHTSSWVGARSARSRSTPRRLRRERTDGDAHDRRQGGDRAVRAR